MPCVLEFAPGWAVIEMQAQIVSLLELCRTGNFGPLRIGSSETEMIEYLGQPTGWGNTKPHEDKFCHYGDVQILFQHMQLWTVHIDWFSGINNVPSLNEPHQLEPWVIRENADLEIIQNALHKESLSFRYELTNSSIILTLESNTKICFNNEFETLTAVSLVSR